MQRSMILVAALILILVAELFLFLQMQYREGVIQPFDGVSAPDSDFEGDEDTNLAEAPEEANPGPITAPVAPGEAFADVTLINYIDRHHGRVSVWLTETREGLDEIPIDLVRGGSGIPCPDEWGQITVGPVPPGEHFIHVCYGTPPSPRSVSLLEQVRVDLADGYNPVQISVPAFHNLTLRFSADLRVSRLALISRDEERRGWKQQTLCLGRKASLVDVPTGNYRAEARGPAGVYEMFLEIEESGPIDFIAHRTRKVGESTTIEPPRDGH